MWLIVVAEVVSRGNSPQHRNKIRYFYNGFL